MLMLNRAFLWFMNMYVSRGQNYGSLRQERAFHGNALFSFSLENDRGLPKNDTPETHISHMVAQRYPKKCPKPEKQYLPKSCYEPWKTIGDCL